MKNTIITIGLPGDHIVTAAGIMIGHADLLNDYMHRDMAFAFSPCVKTLHHAYAASVEDLEMEILSQVTQNPSVAWPRHRTGQWTSTYEDGTTHLYRRVAKDGMAMLAEVDRFVNFSLYVSDANGRSREHASGLSNAQCVPYASWKTIRKHADRWLLGRGYDLA